MAYTGNDGIKTIGTTIANETQIGGNTAGRVGGVIQDIADGFDAKDQNVGYFVPSISGNSVVVSTADAPDYILTKGGSIRLKMASVGIGATTLKVGNEAVKDLWYNGAAVSSSNTWDANEIITVFYDGTRYMASNSQGGGSDLKVVDTNDWDFGLGDQDGNVLLILENGDIKVKNFDSSKLNLETDSDNFADLDIVDDNGNVIVRFGSGHIQTKKFDSKQFNDVFLNHWKGKKWYGFGTSITNTSNEGKYATYLAQISGMTFVNKGHSGGGITTSSNQSIYTDVMTSDLSDADLITLEVGANDGSAPLGTVYDGLPDSVVTDNSTFCGALNLCIRHLQETTNAQIVVMCSPNSRYKLNDSSVKYDGNETSGSDLHTTLDRNEDMRKVCMLNSCYFIPAGCADGMGYARMNASNNYNVDQVHQTNLGGYNFAQAIWAYLKNIPLFYTSI